MRLNINPNPRCICCNVYKDNIGGKRIVRSKHKGLVISTEKPSEIDTPIQSIMHNGEKLFLAVLGWKTQDMNKLLQQAAATIVEGYYPWFCQRCFGRVCSNCNALDAYPSATEVLNDNGTTSHVPILPVHNNCSNNCTNK